VGETWYRGEAEGVAPSRPGGDLHDFGDGLYFTSDVEVAKLYAQTRANGKGETMRVYQVGIDAPQLGRVLDLTRSPRWAQFLNQRPTPKSITNEQLIKLANENYSRMFQAFVAQERIDIDQYNVVIGPEYVRGGRQLCILMKNGQPSAGAIQTRANFKLIFSGGKPVAPASTANVRVGGGSLPEIPTTNSKIGRMMGNQAAVAMAGVMLESLMMSIGDYGIERQVKQQLQTRFATAIGNSLSQGQGVLVIVSLQQWQQEDFNGMKARMLLSVNIEPGPTMDAALKSWRGIPRLLAGAPPGWDVIETYSWIAPAP